MTEQIVIHRLPTKKELLEAGFDSFKGYVLALLEESRRSLRESGRNPDEFANLPLLRVGEEVFKTLEDVEKMDT